MNKIKVGKFIASLRNEKKLTQEQLAEKLHISSYKTISKWECGNTLPDIETFEELSKEFNVSLYELSIGEKIDKDKLHLKELPQYINKKQIAKLKTKTKLKYLLFFILIIISILAIIFTINNFNTTQIYTIQSEDKDYVVTGTLIHTKKEALLTIDNIGYIGDNKDLMNQQVNSYETYLRVNEDDNIYFTNDNPLNDTLKNILNNSIFSTTDKKINKIKKLTFYINYKKNSDKYKTIKINLKLTKTYANNKLI